MTDQQTVKSAMVETEEDLRLVKDAMLLPFMLTLIENNKEKLQYNTDPLSGLYAGVAEVLMNRLHSDLVQVKKQMRVKNIKLIEDARSASALRYRYISRGYEHRFDILRSVAKAEISIRLGQQVSVLMKELYSVGNRV